MERADVERVLVTNVAPERTAARVAHAGRASRAFVRQESGADLVTLVRPAAPSDHDAVRRVHALAFDKLTDARLVDMSRGSSGAISLVALEARDVVGDILFTAARIAGGAADARVAGLGPMAVTPSRQRNGIGSELVQRGLEECHRQGYEAVVVVGHPGYYPRFGFHRGSNL